jgi:hypothetical protein
MCDTLREIHQKIIYNYLCERVIGECGLPVDSISIESIFGMVTDVTQTENFAVPRKYWAYS